MKHPPLDPDATLTRFETVLLEITGNVLALESLRRVLTTADPTDIEFYRRQASHFHGLMRDLSLEATAIQFELASLNGLNNSQRGRIVKRTALYPELMKRWDELQGELVNSYSHRTPPSDEPSSRQ